MNCQMVFLAGLPGIHLQDIARSLYAHLLPKLLHKADLRAEDLNSISVL